MSLIRVAGRQQLNISSDSPFEKASIYSKRKVLEASPFGLKRRAGYIGTPPAILESSSFPSPLDDVRKGHNYSNVDNTEYHRWTNFGSPFSSPLSLKGQPYKTLKHDVAGATLSPLSNGRPSVVPTDRDYALTPKTLRMVQEENSAFTGDSLVHRVPRLIEPGSILNPNKAVVTLDASGKILTVNDMATLIIGEDLMRERSSIFDLLPYLTDVESVKENFSKGRCYNGSPPMRNAKKEPNLKVAAEEDVVDEGGIVVFSGNVVTVDTDMGEMPVSLWMKELPVDKEEDSRWIAVIEPINTTVSKVKIDRDGHLLSVDEKFGVIFGSEAVIDNDNLFNYISLNKLSHDGTNVTKENYEYIDEPCTAMTTEGDALPLCVTIRARKDDGASILHQIYDVQIKLFSNISGLMVVDEKCVIQQYNHNFTRLLFGYYSKDLDGEHISRVLPSFEELSCKSQMKKKLFNKEFSKDESGSKGYAGGLYGHLKDTIPYIDESLKENEQEMNNERESIKMTVSDLNANTEGSTLGTPNKGFIISDSQFTLGSINIEKSTSNFTTTSNPSFSQTVSNEGIETPPIIGSPTQNSNFSPYVMRDITNSMNVLNITEQPDQTRFPFNSGLVTSTPAGCKDNENFVIQEGSYFTTAKHKDGSDICVLYQIRRMYLNGRDQYCIWISWEPTESTMETSQLRHESFSSEVSTNKSSGTTVLLESPRKSFLEESPTTPSDLTKSKCSFCKNSSEISVDIESEDDYDDDDESTQSMTRTDGSSANEYSFSQNVPSVKPRSYSENDIFFSIKKARATHPYEDPEWLLTNGKYSFSFSVLKQIGKGAFGSVRLSYRKQDGLIVVTKFIKKSQVYTDSWLPDPNTGKKICLEVALLMKLNHPNIVKGITYFENDKYFQLVMEKWGSGMDLFEFIEREPALDEALISYIFRQIVSPLLYLKSLCIIHRDIKDENIIINEKFQIKLIDFGSAAYLKEGSKFSQFAGTIEYCSPEVLKGRKYSGPELEVWSLGITLYTIICGENPFNTVDEVLKETFVLSNNYSEDLVNLLSGMLNKDPKERMDLETISSHSWTNQSVDIDSYSFEDIVPCASDELSPPKYITDCPAAQEDSFSTTSSSFVYEDRQSHSAEEGPLHQLPNSANVECDDPTKAFDDVTACSSRTCSSRSASSYKSSVTIDSSVFVGIGNSNRKDTCSSSISDATEASHEINSKSESVNSNESRSSNPLFNSNRSFTFDLNRTQSTSHSNHSSRSSTSSDTSATSLFSDATSSSSSDDEDYDVSEISSSSTSSSSSSSSSVSSSSSSSLVSQETVSADSASDDNTLENTYTNILALEREEIEVEEEEE